MRIFFLLLFSIASLCPTIAQKTIKDVLATVPEKVVPYLNSEQWAEINKFTNTQDSLTIKNSLNGTTAIDSINSSFVRLTLNEVSDLQVKLLSTNDSAQIICVIKTIKKPVPNSQIKFFSTDWDVLSDPFGLPTNDNDTKLLDMLTSRPDTMNVTRYDSLRNLIEPVIVNAKFKGTDNTLTYTLSLPLLNNADKKNLEAIIKQKSFKWDGKNFNKS